jgi:hypothetical protein
MASSVPSSAEVADDEPLTGRRPGDRRIRVKQRASPYFRYVAPGRVLTPEAVAAIGLAHTQGANVGLNLDCNPDGDATAIVGPRN